MTITVIISSLILYVLADYFQDAYNYTGKIKYSERYKLCFVGCVLLAIMIPPVIGTKILRFRCGGTVAHQAFRYYSKPFPKVFICQGIKTQ